MKTIMVIIIAITLFTQTAFAKCEWYTVKQMGDRYGYTIECHLEVSNMIKDIGDYKVQVRELKKAVELKDLVIQKSEERLNLWKEQSYTQHDKLQKAYSWRSMENKLHFFGGVAMAILCVWAAGQLQSSNQN